MYKAYGEINYYENSYAIYTVSYHVHMTHTFGQSYTLSWILVSIPDIFSSWRYSPLNFVYKVYGKIEYSQIYGQNFVCICSAI